jgi:hypothetical protein
VFPVAAPFSTLSSWPSSSSAVLRNICIAICFILSAKILHNIRGNITDHAQCSLHKPGDNYNSVALVRKLTVPTERPPLAGDVSSNFCG